MYFFVLLLILCTCISLLYMYLSHVLLVRLTLVSFHLTRINYQMYYTDRVACMFMLLLFSYNCTCNMDLNLFHVLFCTFTHPLHLYFFIIHVFISCTCSESRSCFFSFYNDQLSSILFWQYSLHVYVNCCLLLYKRKLKAWLGGTTLGK